MIRSEKTFDDLFTTFVTQFEQAGDIDGIIRMKWIVHRELSIQMDEDEMILRATRVKNKTL